MYSFAQRADTKVVDEPLYAYYLTQTGVKHPGGEEVIQSMPVDYKEVLENIRALNEQHQYVFVKNMAHHLIMDDLSFLKDWTNVFLIRDPKELIISFNKVIKNPTIRDIGLMKSFELFNGLGEHATVLDSNEVLKSPETVLDKLCRAIGIPMDNQMLSWQAGARAEDGVWAKYWYENVHQSTGFAKPHNRTDELPQHLQPLYDEAIIYYNKLYPKSIKYAAKV